jgi:hypothetical protein
MKPLEPDPRLEAESISAYRPADEEKAQAAVEAYFGRELKDPYSAVWKFTPLKRSDGRLLGGIGLSTMRPGWFMCGSVNAKNSFGGYVGEAWFIAHFDAATGTKVDQAYLKETREGGIVQGICATLYR